MKNISEQKIEEITAVFTEMGEVKLAYLFGSQAQGEAGAASDYDFAVYLDSREPRRNFEIKTGLMDKLGRLLGSDKIDVVVLDTAEQPELKYNIIQEGHLLLEREPYRLLVEPRIFDFRTMLVKNGLTKQKI